MGDLFLSICYLECIDNLKYVVMSEKIKWVNLINIVCF